MPSYTEEEEAIIRVRNADSMTVEFFKKHMEARHGETILRFKYMDLDDTEYLEACWRAYHGAIHRFGLHDDLDHYHGR
jgi:hypothetical protein